LLPLCYHIIQNRAHQPNIALLIFFDFAWAWLVFVLLRLPLNILRNQQVTGSIPVPSTISVT
jgi:hypothetical protein